MHITVQETFDNDHRVVSQRSADTGRFTFSAADAGQHKICLTADTDVSTGGWLTGRKVGGVKVSLDMAIGETSKIESEDKGKMEGIVQKVTDLNSRLQDIRREQVFQRVCLELHSQSLSLSLFHWLTSSFFFICRNVKPNSAISLNLPILESFAGL